LNYTIGTGALGGAIDDTAQGVGTADSFALARIFASMVQTGLVDGAVGIGAAAGLTVASDASLTVGALLVTQTRQLAHAGNTALTLGTILGVSAHCFALAAHARTSRRAVAIGTATLWLADASALGSGIRVEPRRARTRRLVIDHSAGSVRSAEGVARINATSVQARSFRWAVIIAIGASSICSASGPVSISDLI
jgi:hypothetical protein